MRKVLKKLFKRKLPTQASLFHYIKEKPEESIWANLNFRVLLHPLQFLKEERGLPRRQPSLFHYLENRKDEAAVSFNWKELIRVLAPGPHLPLLISSIFSDFENLRLEREEQRLRRLETGIVSLLFHFFVLAVVIVLSSHHANVKPPAAEKVVYITKPFYLPPGLERTGEGGGGGGGGKQEKLPPSPGAIPPASRTQYMPPEPGEPRPMLPSVVPMTVVLPIDIFQNIAGLPIGDITAPPGAPGSSGPGTGGGIGTGKGTGIGPGTGAGVGPGSGGGAGGGSGGGIGTGIGPLIAGSVDQPPEVIEGPKPPYTEEARKLRIEGIVAVQAVIRRDGTIDSFKITRGLGHGLDESVILTISTKWKFRPGMSKGQPVDVVVNIEVTFRIYLP
jgi:TonB family protein